MGAKTTVTPLPDINKPGFIYLDKKQVYVTEDTSIYIYSLNDLKLIKKFGKRGEGPQEFMLNPGVGPLFLDVSSKDIIVGSFGKISWFTKDATFIREFKLPNPMVMDLRPFGRNYIGTQFNIGKVMYKVLNLYDEKMEIVKEIDRVEHTFQEGKGVKVMNVNPIHVVYNNKLFIAWKNDLVIKVLDSDLKELYTIEHPLERQKIREEDKKKIIHYFKTSSETKAYFELIQPITFPEMYPAVFEMFITGEKIYIVTFKPSDEKEDVQNTGILILDIKGKFLNEVIYPLKMATPLRQSPFTIYEGKLYQLVEDPNKEEWSVHVTKIN
jgi:hypothetical protein